MSGAAAFSRLPAIVDLLSTLLYWLWVLSWTIEENVFPICSKDDPIYYSTNRGIPLPAYEEYQNLVNEDIKPKANIEGEHKWAVENLSQKIGEFGCSQRVLLSYLLAIWCLAKFMKTRWTSSSWCNLLSAWLVHPDLLSHMDYIDVLIL